MQGCIKARKIHHVVTEKPAADDHRRVEAGLGQQRADERRGGRLAVGAGNTD